MFILRGIVGAGLEYYIHLGYPDFHFVGEIVRSWRMRFSQSSFRALGLRVSSKYIDSV